MLRDFLVSLRPWQWYKNLVLFVGIVFAWRILDWGAWFSVLLAFVVFCLLSGGKYLVNDVLDAVVDGSHPKKRGRPVASGRLKADVALSLALVLFVVALSLAYTVNARFFVISVIYLLLTLSYSLFLKNVMIVDVLTISAGFVVRAIAGCWAIDVFVSPWLILCAFLLALFLALGKRRHELVLLGSEAGKHRRILEGYSTAMLDQMINITTSALIMSYSLYSFLAENVYMMVTIPLAIYGLFRYLFLVHARNFGDEPEMLFRDSGMLSSMIMWVALVVAVLYFGGPPKAVI